MVLQKILNKLTDREKLLTEISDFKLELLTVAKGRDDVVKELAEIKRLVNKLQTEKQKLISQMKRDKEKINELEEVLKLSSIDHKRLLDVEQLYRSRFGNVIANKVDQEINAWDADKSFFDHIEKIKGNPFNEQQVQAIRYNMDKNL